MSLGETLAIDRPTPQRLMQLSLDKGDRVGLDRLSPKELILARLIAEGKAIKQIALDLNRSHQGVRMTLHLIYRKLNLRSGNQLVRLARMVWEYDMLKVPPGTGERENVVCQPQI